MQRKVLRSTNKS